MEGSLRDDTDDTVAHRPALTIYCGTIICPFPHHGVTWNNNTPRYKTTASAILRVYRQQTRIRTDGLTILGVRQIKSVSVCVK